MCVSVCVWERLSNCGWTAVFPKSTRGQCKLTRFIFKHCSERHLCKSMPVYVVGWALFISQEFHDFVLSVAIILTQVRWGLNIIVSSFQKNIVFHWRQVYDVTNYRIFILTHSISMISHWSCIVCVVSVGALNSLKTFFHVPVIRALCQYRGSLPDSS